MERRPLPTIAAVLAAPETSDWLKQSLQTALDRDPVDAAADAELLARLLAERADKVLGCGQGRAR
jgi:hypothetical protein